jgi:phage head maturation protease
LGRVLRAWFPGDGSLMGRLAFNATTEGRKAEGMVARGKISGISCGYRVDEWQASDANGDIVDPDRANWDDDLIFEAVRWQLLECSLVSVGADAGAMIRSLSSGNDEINNIRTRMQVRQRMLDRMQAILQ